MTFGTWAAVTDAEFALMLDDRKYEITGLTFAGAGSMAAVAALIQAAILAVICAHNCLPRYYYEPESNRS